MEFIATRLDSPNVRKKKLNDLKSLEDHLIDITFVENLNKKQVNELRENNISSKELISLDYLAKYHGNKVATEINHQEDHVIYLAHNFIKINNREDQKDETKNFIDPIKLFASQSYFSILNSDHSRSLVLEAKDSEDFKSICLFDHIYDYLTESRKSRIDIKDKTILENVENVSYLAIFQDFGNKMLEEIENIVKFRDEVSSKREIELSDIRKFNKLRKNKPPKIEKDRDPETTDILNQYNADIARLNELIELKTEQRSQNLYGRVHGIREHYDAINSQSELSNNDVRTLSNYQKNLNKMDEFFSAIYPTEHDYNEDCRDTKNNIDKLIKDHNVFVKNKGDIDRNSELAISSIPSFKKLLKNGDYKSCTSTISSIEKGNIHVSKFEGKRFFEKPLLDFQEKRSRFYSEIASSLNRTSNSYQDKINEKTSKIGQGNWFSKILIDPFRKLSISSYRKDISQISILQTKLNPN